MLRAAWATSVVVGALLGGGGATAVADGGRVHVPVSIDRVAVSVNAASAVLRDPSIAEPVAGDTLQQATLSDPRTGTIVSIAAVPYGFRAAELFSGSAGVPRARSDAERRWLRRLAAEIRSTSAGRVQSHGPIARIFGHRRRALIGSAREPVGTTRRLTALAYWVVPAGKRLWVVSAARPIRHAGGARSALRKLDLRISGRGLARQTTLEKTAPLPSFGFGGSGGAPWWQGICDNGYYAPRAHRSAYPLGGGFLGILACGPRPNFDGAPDVWRRASGFAGYEWECVEYSMRFMRIVYGIPTYSANGKDVVANYRGTRLVKVANGTAGQAPRPGDVLAEGVSGAGHTAVVSASHVDGAGNGTISVVEQNNSRTGTRDLPVSRWRVVSSPSHTTAWLHDATGYVQQLLGGGSATPPSPPTPTPKPTPPAPSPTPPPSRPPGPSPAPTPPTYAEQQGHYGVNTFTNYHNASGMGPKIAAGQWVNVSCKVHDPTIPSVNPDGYWYRIASSPWNSAYYSPANTFMNGDPWNGPYSHNTDFAVPNC